MNREPAAVIKSMGFFGILKESYKITVSWKKKIFAQIILAILLPLSSLYLSQIHISDFILEETYQNDQNSRWRVFAITQLIYALLILFVSLFSTSTLVYTVSCFYTSKDITFKKAKGVFSKLWGRLLVTFLLCLSVVAIYTGLVIILGFVVFFEMDGAERNPGNKFLIFVICLSIPFFIGFIYMIIVWNMASVISVLEKDYGRKALLKSMKLIKGKILVSSAIYVMLEIATVGIIFTFSLLVVDGNRVSLVGKVFVGIVCYLLLSVVIHFALVIQTIIYFVCKSYHNEDISNVADHLEVSHVRLVKDIQIERVSV